MTKREKIVGDIERYENLIKQLEIHKNKNESELFYARCNLRALQEELKRMDGD